MPSKPKNEPEHTFVVTDTAPKSIVGARIVSGLRATKTPFGLISMPSFVFAKEETKTMIVQNMMVVEQLQLIGQNSKLSAKNITTTTLTTQTFSIASTNLVTNLNADMVDNYHAADFQLRSEKNAANGYAGLDAAGKVTARLAYEGVANGVATLDASGKVTQRLAYEGVANGVATLDAAGKLTRQQLPSPLSYDTTSLSDADIAEGTGIFYLDTVNSRIVFKAKIGGVIKQGVILLV